MYESVYCVAHSKGVIERRKYNLVPQAENLEGWRARDDRVQLLLHVVFELFC